MQFWSKFFVAARHIKNYRCDDDEMCDVIVPDGVSKMRDVYVMLNILS